MTQDLDSPVWTRGCFLSCRDMIGSQVCLLGAKQKRRKGKKKDEKRREGKRREIKWEGKGNESM
jgi:hypothetical protein